MKHDVKLKGQLKLYLRWPAITAVLLAVLNLWIYFVDRKAGFALTVFILVYIVVVCILHFYNKSLILADMVEFAAQYGGVQNTLLEELSIPYAILMDDGRVIWANSQFRKVIRSDMNREIHPGTEQRRVPPGRGRNREPGISVW